VNSSSRIIFVILDGLRPDAVTPHTMPCLDAVGRSGWRSSATTVSPSVTVAALGSLATGVSPSVHGLREGALPPLSRLGTLRPLPAILRRHGRRTAVISARLAPGAGVVARALLHLASVSDVALGGSAPEAVGRLALAHATASAADLMVVYLNHCDVAGHRDGWMSPGYLEAASAVDRAVPPLVQAAAQADALLLFAADHGGGGLDPCDHEGDHPANTTIPLVAGGPRLAPDLPPPVNAHLLDIPPTILAALDLPIPPQYEGRPLGLTGRIATAA
jgi:arylsulfatase A-like enzyme